jgi:hypothetical protein
MEKARMLGTEQAVVVGGTEGGRQRTWGLQGFEATACDTTLPAATAGVAAAAYGADAGAGTGASAIYEQGLRKQLEATNPDDFVAIEPESGDFFLGKTLSDAIQAARAAHPARLVLALRVGHRSTVELGVANGSMAKSTTQDGR